MYVFMWLSDTHTHARARMYIYMQICIQRSLSSTNAIVKAVWGIYCTFIPVPVSASH